MSALLPPPRVTTCFTRRPIPYKCLFVQAACLLFFSYSHFLSWRSWVCKLVLGALGSEASPVPPLLGNTLIWLPFRAAQGGLPLCGAIPPERMRWERDSIIFMVLFIAEQRGWETDFTDTLYISDCGHNSLIWHLFEQITSLTAPLTDAQLWRILCSFKFKDSKGSVYSRYGDC